MRFFFKLIIFVGTITAVLIPLLANPIHSSFCLILLFMSSVLVLFFLKLKFLALIYLIVYIGAIAILILFVIMILNLHSDYYIYSLNSSFCIQFLVNLKLSFLSELCFNEFILTIQSYYILAYPAYGLFSLNDMLGYSYLLYNQYIYFVIFAGFLLLVSMLGTIIIALPKK